VYGGPAGHPQSRGHLIIPPFPLVLLLTLYSTNHPQPSLLPLQTIPNSILAHIFSWPFCHSLINNHTLSPRSFPRTQLSNESPRACGLLGHPPVYTTDPAPPSFIIPQVTVILHSTTSPGPTKSPIPPFYRSPRSFRYTR